MVLTPNRLLALVYFMSSPVFAAIKSKKDQEEKYDSCLDKQILNVNSCLRETKEFRGRGKKTYEEWTELPCVASNLVKNDECYK